MRRRAADSAAARCIPQRPHTHFRTAPALGITTSRPYRPNGAYPEPLASPQLPCQSIRPPTSSPAPPALFPRPPALRLPTFAKAERGRASKVSSSRFLLAPHSDWAHGDGWPVAAPLVRRYIECGDEWSGKGELSWAPPNCSRHAITQFTVFLRVTMSY